MFYRHSVDGIWMSGWLISCRAIFANVDRALNLGFEDSCGDWFAIYFNGLRQAYTDSEQSHEMGILALTTMKKLELNSHLIGGAMLVTDVPVGTLEPEIRRAIAEVDPNLTINSIRTMQQQVEMSFDQERAVASLAGLFGVVALLLAAVGLYGVTAYTVAQRTNEIGIRMALGADRAKVIRLILRGAFQRVMIGLILGLPLAVGAGRLIRTQLYGVSSWDPLALGVAAGALAVCAFFAAIIPANRAASISPMNALRTE